MSAENNADQRRLSSGDTQVNITPDEPSRIGRGRYSNLPASFFEVETDLQSMSRTQLNELLLALQEREEQVPPEPRNQTEHVNLSDKREPSTDLPPERRVAMVYDPDAELQRQEDEFASRRKKESKGSQALGFIHAIIVALLMAVVIRYFVFEAFKIPSGSMEPTLIGDEDTGDHVFVNKLVYSIRDPYRWEVVVFKKPGENRNLIKRCAGLPGEELELSGGEVYANGAMLRKPYELLDQFWRPYFRQTDFSDMLLSRNWRVIGDTRIIGKSLRASGPCELHYIPWERTVENGLVTKSVITDIYPRLSVLERAVTSQGKIFRPSVKDLFIIRDKSSGVTRRGLYEPDTGETIFENDDNWPEANVNGYEEFWSGGIYSVGDLKASLTFTPRSSSGILSIHLVEGRGEEKAERTLDIPLGAEDSRARVSADDERHLMLTSLGRFMPDRSYTVEFMNIDDRLIVVLNGRRVGQLIYKGPVEHVEGNEIYISLSAGAEVTISEFSVARDIFYVPRGEVFDVGEDSYFMLGDNSPKSADSRYFGGVSRDRIVGRAFMVIWPPSRAKFLPAGFEETDERGTEGQ